MQRNPKLPAVHPVHEGEDQDPAHKEAQENDDAVDHVHSAVVKAQLDENLSYRDKWSAELCDVQAADEEITQSSSEEQSDGHKNENQRQVMKDQHPVFPEECRHSLKRMAAVRPGLTSDPLSMVVT